MEERKTVQFKKDEFAIREYIKSSLGKGRISKVRIEYTPIGEKIVVSTNKPGMVIGKKGEKIDELTRVLKKRFKLENPHIEIDEVIKSDLDAQLITVGIKVSILRPDAYLHDKIVIDEALIGKLNINAINNEEESKKSAKKPELNLKKKIKMEEK